VAIDPKSIVGSRPKIRAEDLAKDFVSSAQSFADTFVQYIAPATADESSEDIRRRRRESCAALWAAIVATFEASALTDQERARVIPLVRQQLLAGWNKHCANDPAHLDEIGVRSTHYLRNHDRSSQLATATNIMKDLLQALDPAIALAVPMKRLAAMIAHRMLADLRHLNEIKAGHLIE
jgi:hypothetical protein